MAEIAFLESSRGGRLLVCDNFVYRTNSRKGAVKTHWKCLKGCKANVCLNADDSFNYSHGFHTHEPDQKYIQGKKFMQKLRKRALEEFTVPISKIYREELATETVSVATASVLPKLRTAESILYHLRSTLRPRLSHSSENLRLNVEHEETRDVKNILVGDGKDQILNVGTKIKETPRKGESRKLPTKKKHRSNKTLSSEMKVSNVMNQPADDQPNLMNELADDQLNLVNQPADDEQIFANYVASEFRHIKNPVNKRKLKRIINEAIMHIVEADDSGCEACISVHLNPSTSTFSTPVYSNGSVCSLTSTNLPISENNSFDLNESRNPEFICANFKDLP